MHHTASIGTLVFVDSFSGLIPAKITSAWRNPDGGMCIAVRLTATRGIHRKGEPWVDGTARTIVPRRAIYRSRQACGQHRIRPYAWQLEQSA